MHIPSLLVGSVTTGAGFLLIHRELSHRQRLSSRWILAEEAEKELTKLWESARASLLSTVCLVCNLEILLHHFSGIFVYLIPVLDYFCHQPKPATPQVDVSMYVDDYRKKWNDGVSQVRDFAAKK